MNLDLPVASSELQGGEDSAQAQLVQKIVNTWNGENIWFCDSVEGPIIYTNRNVPSFFLTCTTGLAQGLVDGRMMRIAYWLAGRSSSHGQQKEPSQVVDIMVQHPQYQC